MKKSLITFDLIQYNLYRLEIVAENIVAAKNEILKLDKNLLNKNVDFIHLQSAYKNWNRNEPLQTDIKLIEVEYTIDEKLYRDSISCFELLESKLKINKFFYHILLAETNRYQDIVDDSELTSSVIPLCDTLKLSKTKNLIEAGKATISSKDDDELKILEMIESSSYET